MTEVDGGQIDDGQGEPIPDADLPESERLNKPEATDTVKVPAPGEAPTPDPN